MKFNSAQQKIASRIDVNTSSANWKDWRWQLKHSITSLKEIETVLGIEFPDDLRRQLQKTLDVFPLSVTPYYLSLIDRDDYQNDPIFKQSCPSVHELDIVKCDMDDPLHEDMDSPAPGITHRYPDRVLFIISNTCAMYCRHCTRKRRVGNVESIPDRDAIEQGIEYIRGNSHVRDVLLSGGDPLLLSDDYLEWILSELSAIDHVEVIRIGTRTPVVLPYRITDELVAMLKRFQPLWINTHFNHPREVTASSREALAKLADAGFPLGNQTVLLAGVNDCSRIIKSLIHKLVANRVRPYYLFQCDISMGLGHFRTPVGKGVEIMENLIGHTSGFCVPTYVIDAPAGGGKIPIIPNYLISWSTNKVILRNYEGVITTYHEPESYVATFCDRKCERCDLQLKLDSADESGSIGIAKLLADYDEAISLVPEDTDRYNRRDNETENGLGEQQ